jgi:biopolymer transport protein ExbB/TolQ
MDANAPSFPHGLSFVKLIENADPVVQAVMLGLAVMSFICWTIGFEKLIRYAAFFRQVRRVERLAGAEARLGSASPGLAARFCEIARLEPRLPGQNVSEFQQALERSLQAETSTQMRRLQSGLPLLATVGSTAPFIGLFGTVWGIMNSFAGIAAAKDTSLAVVAPGIAEALLATAIGLAAAIPAVVFYNLANVFLSNTAERLAIAAGRYGKTYACGVAWESAASTRQDERSVLARQEH